MTDYYDLGSHHRAVSTASPEAQLWFDRGLVWCYGFNHDEAVRCFEKAAAIDPAVKCDALAEIVKARRKGATSSAGIDLEGSPDRSPGF